MAIFASTLGYTDHAIYSKRILAISMRIVLFSDKYQSGCFFRMLKPEVYSYVHGLYYVRKENIV